jgi:hypothetical protein
MFSFFNPPSSNLELFQLKTPPTHFARCADADEGAAPFNQLADDLRLDEAFIESDRALGNEVADVGVFAQAAWLDSTFLAALPDVGRTKRE